MGAMYEKGQTKRYSRVASFSGGGKSKKAKEYDDSEERRISKMAEEGDIDSATDAIMNLRSMQSAGKRIMRGLKPTIDEVVKRRPAMKHGGRVKKMAAGGESRAMVQRELAFMRNKGAPKSMVKHEEAEMKNTKNMAIGGAAKKQAEARKMPRPKPRPSSPKSGQMPKPRPKPRPRPGRGDSSMPFKSDKMPRPKSAGSAKVRELMAQKQAKSKKMPRPGSALLAYKNMPRKAGGAVKTKKYAAGGMIPSAGKKSPSSMGTPYRAGGSIKPKKYSGGGGIGGGIDGCAMRGKTRGRIK